MTNSLQLILPDGCIEFGRSASVSLIGHMTGGISSFDAHIRMNSSAVSVIGVHPFTSSNRASAYSINAIHHSDDMVIVTGVLLDSNASSEVSELAVVDIAIAENATDHCAPVELFVDSLHGINRNSVAPHEGLVQSASIVGGSDACLHIESDGDPIVAILPTTSPSLLWNTAMLNGVQVYSNMTIIGLTRKGNRVSIEKADCQCSSEDDDVVKANAACTSIYLDGSEVDGSDHVKVAVTCAGVTGQIHLSVIAPQLPVLLTSSRQKLYRIPGVAKSKDDCDLAVQSTELKAVANFSDGVTTYTNVDVMHWMQDVLKSTNSKVVTLKGSTVEGHQPGRSIVEASVPGLSGIASPLTIITSDSEKNPIVAIFVNIDRDLQINIPHDESPGQLSRPLVAEVVFARNTLEHFIGTNSSIIVTALFLDGTVIENLPGPAVELSVSNADVLELHPNGLLRSKGYGTSEVIAKWNASGDDCDNEDLTFTGSAKVIVGLPSEPVKLLCTGWWISLHILVPLQHNWGLQIQWSWLSRSYWRTVRCILLPEMIH